MVWGLKILGDSGTVQIDDQYANLALKVKGTATTNQGNSATGYWVDISYTGVNPVIAIQNTDGRYAPMAFTTVSGNTWTWRFFSAYPNVALTPSTFNYFIFDRPADPGTSGWGLVVRNNGVPTFNSNEAYMRVLGFLITDRANVGNDSLVASYGNSVAIVQGLVSYHYVLIPTTGNQFQMQEYLNSFRVSGGSVFATTQSFVGGHTVNSGSGYPTPRTQMSSLIINVDNL